MKKILLGLVGVVVVVLIVLVVIVTLSLDSIIKKGVETAGPQITKTELKLDGASLSILSGSGALKGLLVGNPEGYKTPSSFKAGEVGLGLEPRSVFSDKVHVTHVRVQGAEITFEGMLGTQNNLNKILENVQGVTGGSTTGEPAATAPKPETKTEPKAGPKGEPKTQPAGPGPGKKLQVDDLLISGAKVNVSMTMLGGKALIVPIPDIHLVNLGTGPDGITAAELTQRVLKEVIPAVLKAVEAGVADVGKVATDALNSVTKGGNTNLDKATKSIGNLFQKK